MHKILNNNLSNEEIYKNRSGSYTYHSFKEVGCVSVCEFVENPKTKFLGLIPNEG